MIGSQAFKDILTERRNRKKEIKEQSKNMLLNLLGASPVDLKPVTPKKQTSLNTLQSHDSNSTKSDSDEKIDMFGIPEQEKLTLKEITQASKRTVQSNIAINRVKSQVKLVQKNRSYETPRAFFTPFQAMNSNQGMFMMPQTQFYPSFSRVSYANHVVPPQMTPNRKSVNHPQLQNQYKLF
jgi:hypothetical protein